MKVRAPLGWKLGTRRDYRVPQKHSEVSSCESPSAGIKMLEDVVTQVAFLFSWAAIFFSVQDLQELHISYGTELSEWTHAQVCILGELCHCCLGRL